MDLHLKMLTPKLSRVLLSIPCEIDIYIYIGEDSKVSQLKEKYTTT